MQTYIIGNKKTYLRIKTSSMDMRFEIDRKALSWIVQFDWGLRSGGTVIPRGGKGWSLQKQLFVYYNGWEPRQVAYRDGNSRNLKPDNLRGII